MKTVKFTLANGEKTVMQMDDEQLKSFRAVQRPHWREEKRRGRRGASLNQLLDEKGWDVSDETQNPETLLIRREDEKQKPLLLEKLREGLKELSDKQASAIHKRFYLRMTLEEIAEEEGLGLTTVVNRIECALKKLKKLF